MELDLGARLLIIQPCLIPMDIRLFWLSILLALFIACNPCEEDPYGEDLTFIARVSTYPISDSLKLGDTIWMSINIDKDVRVSNSNMTIRLDSFNFFTELFISECSGFEENYYAPIDTNVRIGKLEYLPLPTALVYPILYEEHFDSYTFEAGIVPKEKGLYWIGFSSSLAVLENYNHPAMFICEKNRRDNVKVQYLNSSSNINNFNSMFKRNQVSYLQNMDYEDFASVGSIAVLVH